ncbi:BrnT family toxin [Arsenicitalea aurantiaca]|uniref:BrnT family toxin n=1 Tax=Arsenicitalea aurantiaca TaxID=1783274 RepID=A0A433XK98_9HYPH|nr:BrnT family toxin [Arsenicitalea aurantiaca]RUT34507.1 BrnT family toxin [Arsenicitalea aurantiaca]
MKFEWDASKDRANIAKHGFGFAFASRIFEGPVLTSADERFDYGEARAVSIGAVEGVLVIVVVHTDRKGTVRLISARRANRAERMRYEQALRT